MNKHYPAIVLLCITLLLSSTNALTQEKSITDLDFLIGQWETREDNAENGWWETSTREIVYALKGNFIQVNARSNDSNGRERVSYKLVVMLVIRPTSSKVTVVEPGASVHAVRRPAWS